MRFYRTKISPLSLWSLPFALWVLAGPGCSTRSVGESNQNPGADAGPVACQDLWDCNPGVTCGELVMCEDGQCRPDLGHVIIPCVAGECTADEDCVVALPANCCWGCPEVVSRATLANMECAYEGSVPDVLPPGCDMDCFVCFDCIPQPLGARCDNGQCVPTDLGCPDFSETPVTAVTSLEVASNAAAHDGQVRWLRGAVLPGEGSCDGEGCSAQYRSLLNGVVRLDGYQCNLTVDLIGGECRANLLSHGARAGGWYEFEGIVHEPPSPWEPPWLEVIGSRLIDPEDLGGHYAATITDIQSEVSDPTCTPPGWSVGDTVDVYLARSGEQVRAAAPAFHCEANFSGGFDDNDPETFTVSLPIDCLDCDFYLTGTVTTEQLTAEYVWQNGECRHVVRLEGPRS